MDSHNSVLAEPGRDVLQSLGEGPRYKIDPPGRKLVRKRGKRAVKTRDGHADLVKRSQARSFISGREVRQQRVEGSVGLGEKLAVIGDDGQCHG